ncbi:MAG: group II intron reverse transcriptase domain-containing protein [Akkermansiaceae bacterium]|nr:group II intron reverse transcriptase domain-containing protein [Akkermansiaceae bacterium]MCP5551136.1 group II intron reverse transcriptase domain-containing protein [Akkermansiaceae bacterium]
MPARRQLRRACRLEVVASPENLWHAARLARKRKSRRPDVDEWWLRRETAILRLSRSLLSGEWRPGGYRLFEIHEPKRREIAAAPFEDRVVHHALCRVMQPLLERRFLARSFSCQIGKGTTAARACCRRLTNRHGHVLKCDVSKFFHQIDHAILLEKLAREIRCPGALDLCAQILASYRTGDSPPPPLFPGDDQAEAAERPRGVPIGNLTSQLWGNFYLDALDHRVAEREEHGAYLRYTDDFLLFGDDKARLWELRDIVVEELAAVRLKLAIPKSRLLTTARACPSAGSASCRGRRPASSAPRSAATGCIGKEHAGPT